MVATQKDEHLKSQKLMIVRLVDLEGNYIGKQDVVAIDLIGAGIDETVLVTQEGDAVFQILGHRNAPVHTIIVAIVDKINYS